MQPTTCDRHTVERFLSDGLGDAERAAFENHLGECTSCQNSLDELAAGSAWWQDARGYLSSAIPDTGSMPTGEDGSPDDLFGLKGYLGPTDDPHMLGRLGGYEVVGVVGTGGMGVVLKAFEAPLNRYVAIKALGPQLATSGAARQRFAREAKAAAAVVHDNVIAIHAVAEANGLPYIVMPYVRGSSLEKRLRDTGAFGTDEVLRVGLQVARGLAAAHAQGLVHRDIKPANILLEGGVERVWITDFGLARAVDDASLTRSGVIAGTPQYMSPEQAAGDRVDHRSDLFSLGSVLYALCTGRPPFRASTTLAVLRRVEEDRPRPIREINPDVPEWLTRVVETLMAKNPADRFQSADAVADLFEGYLAHRRQPMTRPAPDLPPPPTEACVELRPVSSRRRWVAPAAVALVAGLALGVAQLPPVIAPAKVGAVPVALVPANAKPAEFYQDFRGDGPLPPAFNAFATEQVTFARDAEGLRIAVPKRPGNNMAGVDLKRRFAGDFEITAGYELLKADRPTEGHGVGFVLRVETATAKPSDFAFFRMTRKNEGDVYWASRTTIGDDDKPDYGHPDHTPATARSGYLRITRVGDEASFAVADGPSGQFHKLFQRYVGAEDIKSIRLAAFPGWEPNPVEVRVKDLRVRTSASTGSPAAEVASAPARPFRAAGLPALLAYGLAATLSLAGVWAVVRRRRQRPIEEPAVSGMIAFACAGCGRRMVVKAEWAGKKGRCVHCRQQMVVPQPTVVEPTTVTIAKTRKFVLPSGHNIGLIAIALLGLSLIVLGLLSSTAHRDDAGPVTRLSGHTGPVHNVRFTPDGKRLVSGSGWPESDQTVRVWDVATGQAVRAINVPGAVHSLDIAPDGQHTLVGLSDGNVAYLDLESGAIERRMKIHSAAVGWVAFAPDGKRGLSTSDDGTACVWDLTDGTPLARYSVRSRQARGGVLLPDGRRMLTADSQGVVQVWDINSPNELKVIDLGQPWMIDGLSLTPDGRQLLIACVGGVRLYDIESGREVRHFQEGTEEAHQAVASPDGRWLIAGDMTGVVRLWNLQTGELIRALGKHNEIAFTVAFSPDGRMAASGGGGERRDNKFVAGTDHDIRLWHLADAAPKPVLAHGTWMMLAGGFVLAIAAGAWLVGRRFGSEAKA